MTDKPKVSASRVKIETAVMVDDMINKVGLKQAYKWMAAFCTPEWADAKVLEWIKDPSDPRTPIAPAPAVNPFEGYSR